jgi:16S rRNA processing protein RimM
LIVGKIKGAHGLHGELKVEILTEDPHRFGLLERVFLGLEEEEPVAWILEGYRLHKGQALLKVQGCQDRSSAQALLGQLVQVPLEEAIPLEADEYYEYQILGLEVWTVDDEFLGRVVDIIDTGASDVYVVAGPAPARREILLPAIEEVVIEIDLEAGRLLVDLLEGLR